MASGALKDGAAVRLETVREERRVGRRVGMVVRKMDCKWEKVRGLGPMITVGVYGLKVLSSSAIVSQGWREITKAAAYILVHGVRRALGCQLRLSAVLACLSWLPSAFPGAI